MLAHSTRYREITHFRRCGARHASECHRNESRSTWRYAMNLIGLWLPRSVHPGCPIMTTIEELNARNKAKTECIAARLLPDGFTASLEPAGRLGDVRFNAYRTAIEGATFDRERRCNIAPANKVAILLGRLQAAGFAIEIDPALASAVQRADAEKSRDVEASIRHANRVDAELRARGLALYPFQKAGVEWLAKRAGGLLADEMGLGKTIQAIVSLPEMGPVLVVCPALVKGTWKRELAKWRPDLRVTVLDGRGSFRWPTPGEVVITNYDILPETVNVANGGRSVQELSINFVTVCPKFIRLIADEIHMVKSTKATRSLRFRTLTDCVRRHGGKTYGLTGTPILNSPPELWSLLQALGIAQEAFGSYKQFAAMMGAERGRFGTVWGPIPDPDAIGKRLDRVMLRRARKEVLPELPGKTYEMIPVDIHAKTKGKMDVLFEAFDQAPVRDTLPDFNGFSQARASLAAEKIPAMLSIVEEYEEALEPLIVFSDHRAPIDRLEKREGWAVITGDTLAAQRTEIEDRFQRGELRGIGATIAAGGVGITLTRTAHVLFVDQNPTPALNAQAEDRVCRIGQTRGCVVKVLVANCALDRRIAELLAAKRELIAQTVEQTSGAGEVEEMSAEAWADLVQEARHEAHLITELPHSICKAPSRLPPSTDLQRWAFAGLRFLSAADPDGARELNGAGFNKVDGAIGHSLAAQTERGLTPKQWELAIALCRKYRRQIGDAP